MGVPTDYGPLIAKNKERETKLSDFTGIMSVRILLILIQLGQKKGN